MLLSRHTKRREFITLLGVAAVAWPVAVQAQQAAMPVIGYLGSSSFERSAGRSLLNFKRGLAETGYVEDRNVTIEYRWADDQYERLPTLAIELVQRRVAVLVAAGSPTALPAKAATTVIPTVFMVGSDPVELGLVASLNRPGGNLTGVAYLNAEVAPKRLELLHELIPTAKSIALLVNPANPTVAAEKQAKELEAAVRMLGLHLPLVKASNAIEIEDAFSALIRDRVEGLQIGVDPLFGNHIDQFVALATRHKMPTIYPWREFTAAGGLDLPPGFRTSDYVRDWLPIRREQCAKGVSRKSRWWRSSARRIVSRCRPSPSGTVSASRRSIPGASGSGAFRHMTFAV
jgi:putative ABC transport system substrate-binding protein